MSMRKIKLLETTLRDGGLGLEDAFINGISQLSFSDDLISSILSNLVQSKIDIIELGAIGERHYPATRFCIYPDIESLSKTKPPKNGNQMYVGLFIGPDTPIDAIPVCNPDCIEGVRVILRYSELKKSLEFCKGLGAKGYKVFVQPMLTMRYTADEIQTIISYANDMGAYALYFVDSYGYMNADDVKRFYEIYDKKLNPGIHIGFHSHNNMNLAYSNALQFIKTASERRNVIVDSCCLGMGQGAGNLQTELIAPDLIRKHRKQYDYPAILDICDLLEQNFRFESLWGYSLTRLLPALYKTAYKYAVVLRHQHHLSYRQIATVLYNMPDEIRNRYESRHLDMLLNQCL